MLLLDPTIVPDRQQTVHQILYGGTQSQINEADRNSGETDVEMIDDTGSQHNTEGMESKYGDQGTAATNNKKKKRNKKKKNKKKEKAAAAAQQETDGQAPIEIEMIVLKPKV